jgi:hypothetical protein
MPDLAPGAHSADQPVRPEPVTVSEAPPATVSAAPGGYIRGGGGVELGGRRVTRTIVWFCAVILGVLVVVLAVAALRENNRANRLRAHGVPVDFTVSSCLGLASGTGITESGYTCRGTFTLGGHTYQDVLRGSLDLYPAGTVVSAVADPHDPSVVATAASVAHRSASWKAFTAAGVTLVCLIVLLAGVWWHSRRRRKRSGVATES